MRQHADAVQRYHPPHTYRGVITHNMEQKILKIEKGYSGLDRWLKEHKTNSLLLVCDDSIKYQDEFKSHLSKLEGKGLGITYFSNFKPNPLYESVVEGVGLFISNKCDAIMAIGGGSAMDVAKCIKLYSNMDHSENYLKQTIVPNDIPFMAMPTTAGTGSEATRYAVIYYEGKKQSVTSESCIPETAILNPNCLKTLPLYQRKATMMDAFCHAIESFWSVNSNEESREYSDKAIRLVLQNMEGYLSNTVEGNAGMLMAAHIAGKAINITQTTAGHAMCYKITSLFRCAHGHAAILCDRVLFPWMIENTDKCIDPRGREYLEEVLKNISYSMGCDNPCEAAEKVIGIFDELQLEVPEASEEDYLELKTSVNPVRLKNHPVLLDENTINELYHRILG